MNDHTEAEHRSPAHDPEIGSTQSAHLLPHQAREIYLRAPHDDDGKPARITVDQVLRVKQIVAEAVDGQAPVEYLRTLERFLIAVVAESGTLRGLTTLDVEHAWQELDRLPLVAAKPTSDSDDDGTAVEEGGTQSSQPVTRLYLASDQAHAPDGN